MFGSSAPRGVLTVTLVEAADLKREDMNGSDPFVQLWMNDDYKQKSTVVENNNNPVWNETFTFNIEENSKDHKLYYKVYDQDTIDNDKIGDGSLDIKAAYGGERLDTWGNLPAKMGLTSHGKLHFIIEFAPQ